MLEALEDRTLLSTSIPLSTTTWTHLGPQPITNGQVPLSKAVTGRVSAIAAHPTDPNTIYVGAASGGVWRTTDAGSTWTPLTDKEQTPFVGSIAIAPLNPNIIYVGTGEANFSLDSFAGGGALKSTDGGNNWTLVGAAEFGRRSISKMIVDPTDSNRVYAAVGRGVNGLGGNQGIWRSDNGGSTWTNITSSIAGSTNVAFTDLAMDPTNASILYAAIGEVFGNSINGVYKTTNATAGSPTWALDTKLPTGTSVGRVALGMSKTVTPVSLYVAMAKAVGTGNGVLAVRKTTDGGTNWTDVTASTPDFLGGQGWYDIALAVDPADSKGNTVYAAGSATTDHIIKSITSGSSWTTITTGANGEGPHVDHHALTFDKSNRLLNGNDGGIWRWDNTNWANINSNLSIVQFVGIGIHPTNSDIALGGTQDNGTDRFNDSLGWTQRVGGDGGEVVISPTNPNNVYMIMPVGSSSAFFRRSTDGGLNFATQTVGLNTGDPMNFYPPFTMDPSNQDRLLLGTNRVYETTNATAPTIAWTQFGTKTFAGNVDSLAIAPTKSSTVYLMEDGRGWVTTDNGLSWTPANPIAGASTAVEYTDIAVDPTNQNTAYVVAANYNDYLPSGGGRVMQTTDRGSNWNNLSKTLPNIPVWSIALDPKAAGPADDVLYVGTDQGVFVSNDQGGNWAKLGTGLPNVLVQDLELNTTLGILAAGTHGRGMWQILVGGGGLPPAVDLNGPAAGIDFTATFVPLGGPVSIVDNAQLTVNDPDSSKLASASVTITNLLDGANEVLTANTGGTSITPSFSAGKLTLSGSDTLANYEKVLRTVTYNNTLASPTTTARSAAFVASDGVNNSPTATATVNFTIPGTPIVDLNGPPAGIDYTAVFLAAGGPVAIVDTAQLTVTDSDSTNLASATVKITNQLDGANEVLGFNTGGTTITGVYTSGTGTLSLTGADTVANYQKVLRTVTYDNTAGSPNNAARGVTFIVDDGKNTSSTATSTVIIGGTGVPSVDLNGTPAGIDFSATFTPGSSPIAIVDTSQLKVTDPDSTKLASAAVVITNRFDGTSELLSANTTGTSIISSYNASTGTLSLTGGDTLANYEKVLRTVTYNNAAAVPNISTRLVTFTVNDAVNVSPAAVSTVFYFKQANGLPVVDLNGAAEGINFATTAGALDQAIPVVDSVNLTVSDPDSSVIASAGVQIATPFQVGFDILEVNPAGTAIQVGYNASTGTLSLTGKDTPANYAKVLRTTTYRNTNPDPDLTTRTLVFVVNDGTSTSFPATATVVPLAPVDSLTVGSTVVTEGNSGAADFSLTLNLSSAALIPVSLSFTTADGTAIAGSDYTATSGVVTFAPGETTQTILIPVLGDRVKEKDETFQVIFGSPTNVTLGQTDATLTIRNDDVPQDVLVLAADAGGAPQVRLLDAQTREETATLYPYDKNFTGGVRVAMGDVTGDGIPDLITAPGPGSTPLIQVIDGQNATPVRSFVAFELGLAGVQVAAGDVNGDGLADIIAAADIGSAPIVQVFSGKDGTILRSLFAYDPAFLGGVSVAAGDVNGDGFADIITAPGPGSVPFVQVFSGKDGGTLGGFFAYDPLFAGGVSVAAGDTDGSGKAQIITGARAGGAPFVRLFTGGGNLIREFFAYDPAFGGGVQVAGVDVNGDGRVEVITTPGPGVPSFVRIFDAVSLAQIDSFFAFDPQFPGGAFVAGTQRGAQVSAAGDPSATALASPPTS